MENERGEYFGHFLIIVDCVLIIRFCPNKTLVNLGAEEEKQNA